MCATPGMLIIHNYNNTVKMLFPYMDLSIHWHYMYYPADMTLHSLVLQYVQRPDRMCLSVRYYESMYGYALLLMQVWEQYEEPFVWSRMSEMYTNMPLQLRHYLWMNIATQYIIKAFVMIKYRSRCLTVSQPSWFIVPIVINKPLPDRHSTASLWYFNTPFEDAFSASW